MHDGWLIFSNLALPFCAGITFFALARYVLLIAPMRRLVTGELTYKGAAWGFAFFGVYLISRPLQILLGPHPMPLLINSIREYCMMGLFAPAVFVAMMSLCFGADEIPKKLIVGIFVVANLFAAAFLFINIEAIGGSEMIFRIGTYRAYDGVWFHTQSPRSETLMALLFVIRFIDPLFLLFMAGVIVFRHARHYPASKRAVYDNMPKKLYLLSAAVFAFPVSMLITGILVFSGIPNQWWVYYIGAIGAGFLEAASLRLSLRRDVQVSEHQ
jgi:hypothetical protein